MTCSAGDEVRAALEEEPGTYFLTDFLARTFEHTVWRELGLDRYPELRDEYFRHYTRVIWLAQRPTPATRGGGGAGGGADRVARWRIVRSATGASSGSSRPCVGSVPVGRAAGTFCVPTFQPDTLTTGDAPASARRR